MKKIISMMMVVICICGTHYNVRAEENEYIESDIILEDGFIEDQQDGTEYDKGDGGEDHA